LTLQQNFVIRESASQERNVQKQVTALTKQRFAGRRAQREKQKKNWALMNIVVIIPKLKAAGMVPVLFVRL